jgi:hypothetical protein
VSSNIGLSGVAGFLLKGAGLLILIAAGFYAGSVLAWSESAKSPGGDGIVYNGIWFTSTFAGSADQSSELRAYVARTGILALAQSEVLYYQTGLDDEGRPLETRCQYQVRGGSFDSDWWSLAVYDDTNHYFPIPGVPASFNSVNVPVDEDGRWTIAIGTREDADHAWVPILDTGGFNLLLRLYRPGEDVRGDLADAEMPTIRRLSCD